MDTTGDPAVFRQRLAEVIAWCAPRGAVADPAGSLRTPTLGPADLTELSWAVTRHSTARLRGGAPAPGETRAAFARRLAAEFARLGALEAPRVEAERLAIVEALADRRAALLRAAGEYPAPEEQARLASDLGGGRLLVSEGPDMTVRDAAANAVSRGFFDEDDLPPWDTWISYVPEREGADGRPERPCLVRWVPPAFFHLAEQGIWVNPVGCMRWAQQDESPFLRHLRTAGVIPASDAGCPREQDSSDTP